MLVASVLLAGLVTFSCSSTGYNTQKGTAVGAGVGAIAGRIIGNNTAGTLIGAAVGALGGALVGNAMDQNETDQKTTVAASQRQSVAPPKYLQMRPMPLLLGSGLKSRDSG